MRELLDVSLQGATIIPTVLLIFVLVYWLIVMVGLIDIDSFDVDIDLDVDIDGGVDVSSGGGADSVGDSVMGINHILAFFNLAHIPLMVFLSFLAIPFWLGAVAVVDYLGVTSWLLGLALLVPNFIVSMFIAKYLTWPFVKLFKAAEKEENVYTVGQICTVKQEITDSKVGRAEVKTEGAPLRLMVRTTPGTTMHAGETGLVIDRDDQKNIYIVEPYTA